MCVFLGGKGGGTPLRHKQSYKDLNLKDSTSEWDSNPRAWFCVCVLCDSCVLLCVCVVCSLLLYVSECS